MHDLTAANQDHDLFENMIVERCDIYGMAVDYFILNFAQADNPADPLYGENPNPVFIGPISTKVNCMPIPEDNIGDVFGIVNTEIPINITIPKYTFTRDTSAAVLSAGYTQDVFYEENRAYSEPMAGDVMRFIFNDLVYEITSVCHSETVFLGKKLYWELKCKQYKITESPATSAVDAITSAEPLSSWGDNQWIEDNRTEDYAELPNLAEIYGYE
jgi:hypothetical protein